MYAHDRAILFYEWLVLYIGFEPKGALASSIDSNLTRVQCAVAPKWAQIGDEHSKPLHEYDWTFSPSYAGSMTILDEPWRPTSSPDLELDMDLLRQPDPILWFDHVLLFEDELHDHGISSLSVRFLILSNLFLDLTRKQVKVRLMPKCFFILLRHWLRVDGT